MKKTIKALKLPSIFLLIIVSFIACDKDFSIIESDVLGKENSNFTTNKIDISVLAYNKKLEAIQINGLASNLLGVFNDPAYGQTTASIVAQVIPSNVDPDFGDNPVIDSVILKIPYYSTQTGDLDDNDNATYSIDSLYGSSNIKLSIYQNNYFLRDFNPNSGLTENQNYYSFTENTTDNTKNFALTDNSEINFDDHIGSLIYDESFTPSSDNIYLYTYDDDGVAESINVETPALRIKFDDDGIEFWKQAILDQEGENVLSNTNNFKDYFRGLYFKAENISDDGNMVLLNTASSDANIVIYYSYDSTTDTSVQLQSTYTLSFSGNTLNTFINDYDLVLEDGDETLGDEKLYLKGAEGSMAIVDLNGFSGLDDIKADFIDGENPNRLINEAVLVVYEDDETRNTSDDGYHTYDRLYVYDVNNNITTIDYSFDATDNSTDPFNSKFIHLGQRDTIGDGFGFKIRITEHIKNIIYEDSTNTKLGLVLSNNVNYTTNAALLNSTDDVTRAPAASIITPRGSVVYGSLEDAAVPEDRRMKLIIYYTEPK